MTHPHAKSFTRQGQHPTRLDPVEEVDYTDAMATLLEASTKRSTDAQSLYFALHRKSKLKRDERVKIITAVILAGFEGCGWALSELIPEGI